MSDQPSPTDALARALRRAGRPDVAQALVDAELGGATGSEILGRIGVVLRLNAGLRKALDDDGRRAWDALQDAVERAWPGSRLRSWVARLFALLQPSPSALPVDPRPLAERFADAQCRAAFLAIRSGLADGSLDYAAARKQVVAIRPPVFDSGVSDGDKQLQDYEKRQLYAALDAAERQQPTATGHAAAELFESCMTTANLH